MILQGLKFKKNVDLSSETLKHVVTVNGHKILAYELIDEDAETQTRTAYRLNMQYEDGTDYDVRNPRLCACVRSGGKQPDPCLGMLPGVTAACCEHQGKEPSYIKFANGTVIRGNFTVYQEPEFS